MDADVSISSWTCSSTNASTAGLGTYGVALVTSEKASRPGMSATAARAGPRPKSISRPRSRPVTQPAAKARPSRVSATMWGTPKSS